MMYSTLEFIRKFVSPVKLFAFLRILISINFIHQVQMPFIYRDISNNICNRNRKDLQVTPNTYISRIVTRISNVHNYLLLILIYRYGAIGGIAFSFVSCVVIVRLLL